MFHFQEGEPNSRLSFDSKGTSQDFKRNQELSNIIMHQCWLTIENMDRPLAVSKLVLRSITTVFEKSKT
jgi:hypothetical protein